MRYVRYISLLLKIKGWMGGGGGSYPLDNPIALSFPLNNLLTPLSPSPPPSPLPPFPLPLQVDVSAAFAYTSAVKDSTEIGLLKKACQLTCTIFSKYVKREIVTIVDDEKRVKHSKIAEDIEEVINEGKHIPPGLDPESVREKYDK